MSISYTLKSYRFLFCSCFLFVSIVNVALKLLSKYDKFVWVNVVFILNQDTKLKRWLD